jgi:hypothetical protein
LSTTHPFACAAPDVPLSTAGDADAELADDGGGSKNEEKRLPNKAFIEAFLFGVSGFKILDDLFGPCEKGGGARGGEGEGEVAGVVVMDVGGDIDIDAEEEVEKGIGNENEDEEDPKPSAEK